MVISPFLFKNIFISCIVMYLINVFCFCGVLGIFDYFELNNITDALLIPFCIFVLEMSIKYVIVKLKPIWVIKSSGLILSLVAMLSSLYVLSEFNESFFGITDTLLIIFLFTFLVVRYVINLTIKSAYLKKKFFKFGGK